MDLLVYICESWSFKIHSQYYVKWSCEATRYSPAVALPDASPVPKNAEDTRLFTAVTACGQQDLRSVKLQQISTNGLSAGESTLKLALDDSTTGSILWLESLRNTFDHFGRKMMQKPVLPVSRWVLRTRTGCGFHESSTAHESKGSADKGEPALISIVLLLNHFLQCATFCRLLVMFVSHHSSVQGALDYWQTSGGDNPQGPHHTNSTQTI